MKSDASYRLALAVFLAFGVLLVFFGGVMMAAPIPMSHLLEKFLGLSTLAWNAMALLSALLGAIIVAGARPGPLRYWFLVIGGLAVLKGLLFLIPDVGQHWISWFLAQPTSTMRGLGTLDLILGAIMLWWPYHEHAGFGASRPA